MNAEGSVLSCRAWYAATVADFLRCPSDRILGQLVANSDFAVDTSQRDAWIWQISILQPALQGLNTSIFGVQYSTDGTPN